MLSVCLSVFFVSFLFAQAGAGDPASWQSQGWIIAGIFALIGSANQGLALWDKLFPRKSPPDHEVYASKTELTRVESAQKTEISRVETAHKEEMLRIEKRFAEWLTQQAAQHEEEMQVMREWRDELGKWQLNIERAMGHVETKADVAMKKKG